MTSTRLFQPLKIGDIVVKHRVGMAPLTRLRADEGHVPTPMMVEYYEQRASAPGTLIIAEATYVSPAACGCFPRAPGLWSRDQIASWRKITDAVHSKGSFIYSQLFAAGRSADLELAKQEGVEIVGPSAIPIDQDCPVPRELSTEEIGRFVQDFAVAAKSAVAAGFDGVELHGANGYLIDQFNQDVSNKREDQYGGSIENRSRFFKEIMSAVADAIGSSRVAIRLSPWAPFQAMRMEDPVPQFTDLLVKANELQLAYVHLVEPRVTDSYEFNGTGSLDFVYETCRRPLVLAGGYTLDEAKEVVDTLHPDRDIMVMFGRSFLANPDLVFRFQSGLDLNSCDRDTFYTDSETGYVDYPFSKEFLATTSH